MLGVFVPGVCHDGISPRPFNERGNLVWLALEDGQQRVYTHEPMASIWRRMGASFLSLFPVSGQL